MSLGAAIHNISSDLRTILENPHCVKLPTIARYLRIACKQIAVQRGLVRPPAYERVGRYSAHFQSYDTFCSIWREVYAKTPYYFRTDSESPVILDAGSNIGLSVLYFAELYPKARITAFEPDPGTFRLLSDTMSRNNLNVELVNKAVYSHTGALTWHGGDPGSLSSSIVARDDVPHTHTITVPCVRLSEYVTGPIDLLKLDVEGVEVDVLGELAQSGRIRSIQRMAVEFHPWAGRALTELMSMLTQCGFRVTQPDHLEHIVLADLTA